MPSTSTFHHCDLLKAKVRAEGDISAVFNSFNKKGSALDESYAHLKRSLIKDPEALKKSWIRLKSALAKRISETREHGSSSIPVVQFNDLNTMSEKKRQQILGSGSLVVKGVIPKNEAIGLKSEVLDYIKENPSTKGFPSNNPAVYELYWSKSQIKARAHENLRKTNDFMNNLWHASPDTRINLDQNMSYADRLRIRQPGDAKFALGPHVDGGSLERWEDEEYSKCYSSIFEGKWEEFDPYDATHRVNMDLNKYDSSGTCTVFRSFQGWLAVSEICKSEGTILLAPQIKELTAYWMLKPFFDSNDNIKFDSTFPGAYPGMGQEFDHESHPDLDLDSLLVPVPRVEPGDMVYWHCDMIHAVDKIHRGSWDSSVFYIPSTPLCDINLKYALFQREAFLRGLPGPDFPGFPTGLGESHHKQRASYDDIVQAGGIAALQEMGLAKLDDNAKTKGGKAIVQAANELLFV